MNSTIPIDKQEIAIADVGRETGIWLLELNRRLLKPSSRLCGLDISGDQFPRPEWLPETAQFVECDTLDPAGPPADLVGAFDVVHIRLFIAIIKNINPTALLDFGHKILKAGGHSQWDDQEPSVNRVGSHNGFPTEGVAMIDRMTRTHEPTDWTGRLPQTFEERGSQVVAVDKQAILPWQWGMYIDNYCMLADEFVQRAELGG